LIPGDLLRNSLNPGDLLRNSLNPGDLLRNSLSRFPVVISRIEQKLISNGKIAVMQG